MSIEIQVSTVRGIECCITVYAFTDSCIKNTHDRGPKFNTKNTRKRIAYRMTVSCVKIVRKM